MATVARVWPAWSQEPGDSAGSPMWVQGPEQLTNYLLIRNTAARAQAVLGSWHSTWQLYWLSHNASPSSNLFSVSPEYTNIYHKDRAVPFITYLLFISYMRHIFFFLSYSFVYLKGLMTGKESGRTVLNPLIYSLNACNSQARSGWTQRQGTVSRASTWLAGTQILASSSAASQDASISRELDLRQSSRVSNQALSQGVSAWLRLSLLLSHSCTVRQASGEIWTLFWKHFNKTRHILYIFILLTLDKKSNFCRHSSTCNNDLKLE